MLTMSTGLDPSALAEVARLEQAVVAHDGGRLKLELDYVEKNPIEVALVHEGDRLVGYAGLYAFGGDEPEIAGMVAPDARRLRHGTQLLEALLPLARDRGARRALLVVPSTTPAGQAFAESRGTTRSHSEHYLVLGDTPATTEDPATRLRTALPDDVPELQRIVAAAFRESPRPLDLDRVGDTTYVIEHNGAIAGHVRLTVAGDWGAVYGFAIDPALQGKGIGRDVLARACRLLRADGRGRVTLEVETENASALHLYTSTGFTREAGEDYWALDL